MKIILNIGKVSRPNFFIILDTWNNDIDMICGFLCWLN